MKISILNLSSVFLFATLLIVSCKKKDTTEPSTSGNGGGTTTSGIYGNMQAGYYDYDYGGGVTTKDSMVIASFYQSPMSSVSPTNIYAGTVTVNGANLDYSPPQNYYIENTHSVSMNSLVWNATGSGTVTPFSYTYTPVYPKISGAINISDTCYKSSGISVSLSGISNASGSTIVYLYQGSNSLSKSIFTSAGTVNFTPTELSSFATNSSLSIMVFLTNVSQQTIGSVKYQFSGTYTYTKFSYLKL